MDIEKVISDLGFPIAMSLASLWGAFYLIKYITGNLTELLVNRFEELRNIIIKLIDKQKEMEIKLSEWSSNTDTLVKFIIDLQMANKKKEKQDLIEQLKESLNGNGK